jgi:hypothetical protein
LANGSGNGALPAGDPGAGPPAPSEPASEPVTRRGRS